MKLSFHIISRISIALLALFAAWTSLFYFIIVEEINDETDDSLEDYSEFIITRALAGEALPSEDNGTNNSYHLAKVSSSYAAQHAGIRYYDEMVYITSKRETEPARMLKTIFKDAANEYYELTVSIPTIEKSDLQETILWWIVILYMALLLAIIIINVWVLHRSFRPLYNLLTWLDNFKVERVMPEFTNPTNVTEFRKLNEAVVRSAIRNIEAYEQQKAFIGHASHELQTPLAVCRNRLEMLSEDAGLTESQLSEIFKTKASVDHLIKLNKTLLLLTKIENNQFVDQKEIVVNELIRILTGDYAEVYADRHITVSIQEEAVLTIRMNEMLATVLFGNLLKNAYLHNCDLGKIHILITASSIILSNTGAEKALDAAVIFNRFYQGSKKEGSTGLGLALCKSVCDLYGFSLRYVYLEEKHVFSVLFS